MLSPITSAIRVHLIPPQRPTAPSRRRDDDRQCCCQGGGARNSGSGQSWSSQIESEAAAATTECCAVERDRLHVVSVDVCVCISTNLFFTLLIFHNDNSVLIIIWNQRIVRWRKLGRKACPFFFQKCHCMCCCCDCRHQSINVLCHIVCDSKSLFLKIMSCCN